MKKEAEGVGSIYHVEDPLPNAPENSGDSSSEGLTSPSKPSRS